MKININVIESVEDIEVLRFFSPVRPLLENYDWSDEAKQDLEDSEVFNN